MLITSHLASKPGSHPGKSAKKRGPRRWGWGGVRDRASALSMTGLVKEHPKQTSRDDPDFRLLPFPLHVNPCNPCLPSPLLHSSFRLLSLPPLPAAGPILELGGARTRLEQLLAQANEPEIYRELDPTPQAARNQALAQNRSVLRRALRASRTPSPSCSPKPKAACLSARATFSKLQPTHPSESQVCNLGGDGTFHGPASWC